MSIVFPPKNWASCPLSGYLRNPFFDIKYVFYILEYNLWIEDNKNNIKTTAKIWNKDVDKNRLSHRKTVLHKWIR